MNRLLQKPGTYPADLSPAAPRALCPHVFPRCNISAPNAFWMGCEILQHKFAESEKQQLRPQPWRALSKGNDLP